MNEKEKYLAEVEARMNRFHTSIEDITAKRKMRNETRPEIDVDGLRKRHEGISAKLKDIQTADDANWDGVKGEVDQMMGDIDRDLRAALANYH